MVKFIKRIDTFNKNIILVFIGTNIANAFNLLYQLLIAHRMTSVDFAGFNSLLAIFSVISAPLTTLQVAVVKYTADFNAQNQVKKVRSLLSGLFRKALLLAFITFVIFYFSSAYITDKLKIPALSSGYVLAGLLGLFWIVSILTGALQGLELFKWLVSVSIITGALKLVFTYIFLILGFNITGALCAFLLASIISIAISFFPLKGFFVFEKLESDINLKGFLLYLAPVAVGLFSFLALVNIDMILVKYFFTSQEAGSYSLSQMVGKIFLFLPGAISIVMFPKAAGLNSRNMGTESTLRRSLLYGLLLCVIANLVYNLFPSLILKILTGKAPAESVALGRLFGISMSFFALLFVLVNYFLSIKDLRFMKYLVLSVLLELLAIILLHKSIIFVQGILCVNSFLLFLVLLLLAFKK